MVDGAAAEAALLSPGNQGNRLPSFFSRYRGCARIARSGSAFRRLMGSALLNVLVIVYLMSGPSLSFGFL